MKKLMMILCTILCANILAAQTFTSGGLKYTVIYGSHSVQVTQQNSSDISGSVVIPSTVTYDGTTYSVTSIGWSAFAYCSGLTSVTIPTGVTSIGEEAFKYCSGLTSINVASGNTHYSSIDGVLYNHVQDTLIQCPGAKTSITIPNSVTSIGSGAFYGCSGLTSVTIPTGVTSIGGSAFYGCSSLTSINVASNNTHYSSIDGVLYNHVQDTLIQCPGAKTSITIPNSVTSIGEGAFDGCSGLTSVTIPNSVTSIEDWAFYGCSSLTSVTIGNSVTYIGSGAFNGCSGLTILNFNAINCQDFSSSYHPFSGTSLTTVNIGDSVQRIPAYFVSVRSRLTSITIPNSVTSIGDYAFNGCSGLTSVTIPNSVTSIGGYAFNGCSGLTSVTIGDRVTSIENSVFRGCTSLDSITIGTGVAYIEQRAFNDCSRLTTLNFNAINCQDFSSDYYYTNFSNTLTTVNIGDSVQRIPANFVRGCSGLTSVTIPNSVTSIGSGAFNGCSGLTSVTIPTGVTSIGDYAFEDCSGLTSVSIPNSVTSIGEYAFSGCSSLTSVTIPTGVTSIGEYAFNGCSGLTSVTLPNSLTSISNAAFSGCRGLTSITLPNSVTSIGDRAFYECLNLSSLISLATVPPTIGNEAFPYPNICTVTVPCGSLAAYTASTCYWSVYFPQRITESSSFELSVSANDEAYGRVEVENHSCESKTLTAIANNGYEFTGWNDGNTENPRTVTVTSDTAFVAIFTEAVTTPTITVTVNDATMGSASYTMDGNTAILTATANEGYRFLTWNDGNMENPRTVTITSDTAFMAIFTASGSSSLQEVNAREFALYPNPAKSFVTLEFEALQENASLQILDINGRRVRTLDLKAGQETLRIDLGDLPKGVYTIMLGNVTKKLIVE